MKTSHNGVSSCHVIFSTLEFCLVSTLSWFFLSVLFALQKL